MSVQSKSEFVSKAKAIKLVIDGVEYPLDPKQFSTGSVGWNYNGKGKVAVGDGQERVQIGVNVTVIGSKELPEKLAA